MIRINIRESIYSVFDGMEDSQKAREGAMPTRYIFTHTIIDIHFIPRSFVILLVKAEAR